jgi:hypothetical protein
MDQTPFTYPCLDRFSDQPMPTTSTTNGTTYVMTGDVAKMRDIFGSLPIKISVSTTHGTLSFDRTNLSTSPLDASTFALPTDDKLVTEQEYNAQEQAAMMQHFRNMGGPHPPSAAP